MKIFKIIGLCLLLGKGLSLVASDTLYYRFNNFYVKPASPKDTMIFEVEIRSSTLNTYLVGVQVDIQFYTAVFGINAKPAVVQRLALVEDNPPYMLEPPIANTATNKFRWACSQLIPPYDITQLSLVPTTTWGKLVRFKMLVNSNTENAGILFDIAPMEEVQYFCLTTGITKTKYHPVVAWNTLANMPSTPTNFSLFISEVGAPLAPYNEARFIEIYNPGSAAVDFSVFPWYITQETNGSSRASVQLTGSIPAGGTFVIAHDQTALTDAGFTANQYSTVIDNGGAETFVLSIYGEYNAGRNIDIYGQIGTSGVGQPWYFGDSHAVRYFEIISPSLTWIASQWSITDAENIDLTPGSHRTTLIWNGSQSSDWRSRDNWSPNFIPDVAHDASIPSNATPYPILDDIGYCHDFHIAN